ncbi:MAG TPA: hypothetical protein VF207_01035 [Chthoniobacterales bacterium]
MALLNWLKSKKAPPRTEPVPASSAGLPDSHSDQVAPPRPEPTISLRLQPILKMLPPQLGQPTLPSIIDTDEEIALPFKLIQSQLSSSRVVVKAATLLEAMPEHIRTALSEIDSSAKIPIPLQEIFRNLPNDAIKLRDDQVIEHPDEIVPTPFAEKAQEDAKRFAKLAAPPGPDVVVAPPDTGFAHLNSIFLTDEPLDLPAVLAKIAQLPAIEACLLTTGDGRIISGSLGNEKLNHTVQTLISRLFDESKSKLSELGLSPLQTITYFCRDEQLSSFGQDNVYLTVLHRQRPFKPGVREKIFRVLAELAKMEDKIFT